VDVVSKRLRTAIDPLPLPLIAQVVFRAEAMVSVATETTRSREWCKGKRALLVSGVGHHASFRSTAQELGIAVLDEVAYPDHYAYSADDVGRLRKRAVDLKAEVVVTTEKDAGKLRPYLAPDDGSWWAVRLGIEWRTGETAIRKMILDAGPTTSGGAGD
jgi:tetraacyldisaccharide 4'-kinase